MIAFLITARHLALGAPTSAPVAELRPAERASHPPQATSLTAPSLQQQLDNLRGKAAAVLTLPPGSTELRTSLRIGPEHKGLAIEAHASGSELCGALQILTPRWVEGEDGSVELELDSMQRQRIQGSWQGPVHSGHGIQNPALESTLWVGSTRMQLARWPNQGFTAIEGVIDAGSVPRAAEDDVPLAERKHEAPRGARLRFSDRERLGRWAQEPALWASGYWNWDWSEEHLPIASVDGQAQELRLGLPHRYGVASRGRFFVRNAKSELDVPGEYWVDAQAGRVYARLEPRQRAEPVRLTLLGDPLIIIKGAEDVTLRGLRCAHTRGIGVQAEAVKGLELLDCAFEGLGTSGAELAGENITLRGCSFEQIGGMGVRLSGGDRATLSASGSRIDACRFERTSQSLRTYHPAVQLEGVGHVVRGCEFGWLPHFALMAWGNDHNIEANRFHHCVEETGDAGAIYFGRDWTTHGNRIAGNLFHDITGSNERFQNGVYLDDMASGIVVEENSFVRCNWGVLVGGGRDNLVQANRFIDCGKALHYDARGVGWMKPALADPATSTILKRYAALPIGTGIWQQRFPSLASYLDDRMGRPVGGRVIDNLLYATPLGLIEDRDCVEERGTLSLESEPGLADRIIAEWISSARR